MADSQSYIRAKAFRRQLTPPEARLWNCVRGRRLQNLKFRRQHPIGPYILDFYCADARLAVEIDGSSHEQPEQIAHDRRRTTWLGQQGIRVVRLRASDVRDELEGVLAFLVRAVNERRAYRLGRLAPSWSLRDLSSPSPFGDGEVNVSVNSSNTAAPPRRRPRSGSARLP